MFVLKESEEQSSLTVKFLHPVIEVKAYTFKALSFILHLSEDYRLFETKACLESKNFSSILINKFIHPMFMKYINS